MKALARMYGGGRIVVGLGFALAPAATTRNLIGDVADTPGAQTFIRGLGVRDVVLGTALFQALERGDAHRQWLVWSGLCGLADLAANAAVRDRLPGGGTGAVAFTALDAISGLGLALLMR